MLNPVLEDFFKAGGYYLYQRDYEVLMEFLFSTKGINEVMKLMELFIQV